MMMSTQKTTSAPTAAANSLSRRSRTAGLHHHLARKAAAPAVSTRFELKAFVGSGSDIDTLFLYFTLESDSAKISNSKTKKARQLLLTCLIKYDMICRRLAARSSASINLPPSVSSVKPLGDNIFIKIAGEEDKTTGGVLLPVDARTKPTAGEKECRVECKTATGQRTHDPGPSR